MCNAPEGYGKDWRVRVKRGGLISSETSFLVSYHPPTVDGVISDSKDPDTNYFPQKGHIEGVPTVGSVITITGNNFGPDPMIMLGNADPFINSDGDCQCGTLGNHSMVCGDYMVAGDAGGSSPSGLRGKRCYLQRIESPSDERHKKIIAHIPPGVGEQHRLSVIVYNQEDGSHKLSFSPPQITGGSASSGSLQSTD